MNIAVCCAASNEIDIKYKESSKRVLNEIFKRNNNLVFGKSNTGIMGIAYNIAKQRNRKVIGVVTERYTEEAKEVKCDIEIVTKSVNKRTEGIISNSDALIFLPGGIGTLYELMTAIEMKRNEEFKKPIIICNETGFFDEILMILEKVYKEKFANFTVASSYNIANDNEEVIKLIENI